MGTDFSGVGRLLANPARGIMIDLLLDGRAMTSGELARAARVSPSTASEHLADLSRGGLVSSTVQGRHRYYTLGGTPVATALEALSQICPATAPRSLRQSSQARALGVARTCYDHLAGMIAVQILDRLLAQEWLLDRAEDYALSPAGVRGLTDLGVDVSAAARRRRHFARPCLDWTERRPHLSGSLGAAMAATLIQRGWFDHAHTARALRITETGHSGLRDVFGLSPKPGSASQRVP